MEARSGKRDKGRMASTEEKIGLVSAASLLGKQASNEIANGSRNIPPGLDKSHQEDTCDSAAIEEEDRHFLTILNSFRNYKSYCLQRLCETEENFQQLPPHHQRLLPGFKEHLQRLCAAVHCNSHLIQLIVGSTGMMFENREMPSPQQVANKGSGSDQFHMEKVISTLKQFVRDWSSEGQTERDQCYTPILDFICQLFPDEKCRSEISCLVPGAGLGRLAFELAERGFSSQGNEFSYFMLCASNFIINRVQGKWKFKLYPFIMQFCNNVHTCDQLQSVLIPDISPNRVNRAGSFTMVAGDFLEVYKEGDSWDVVASSFFLDTAHNVIDYLERIYFILKPGGHLINIGPLLYHFTDMPNEYSIELSYEQIRRVMCELGFHIVKEDLNIKCTYTQNEKSMMHYSYNCVFFIAQKPISVSDKTMYSEPVDKCDSTTASSSAETDTTYNNEHK